MAVYYKPQSPIQSGEDFIYPITTADQVKVDKDTRLNAVGVYLKNIDNSTDTTVYGNNATTLGGVAAEDYALKTDTAPDSSKLGGKAPEYYIQPRNLLDNSDFEIAQAGYGGKHGSTVYVTDRWMQNDTTERTYTYTTKNGHGALKCSTDTRIQQKLLLVDGQNYTAAFYINNTLYILNFVADGGSHGTGAIWVNYQSDGTYMFVISNIPAGGIVYEPVLYIGTYTADTLPPYVPKGYAAELAECQRYFKHVRVTAVKERDGQNYYSCSAPIYMRTVPTITINSFSPYGESNISDFTGCSVSCDKDIIFYAALPTCTAHNVGGLAMTLSADL